MIRRAIIVLILMALAAGIVAWWLWDQAQVAPRWYAPPDPASVEVAERAEQVEYRLAEEVQKIRGDQATWIVRIPQSSINAWLASRLPEWTAHEQAIAWPAELGVPQVRIEPAGIELAVDVTYDGRRAVLVTRAVPSVDAGMLRVAIDRVGLGRVTLPGRGVEHLLKTLEGVIPAEAGGDEVVAAVRQLLREGTEIPTEVDLADGRRVEILGVQCNEGSIEFRNRTLPPE